MHTYSGDGTTTPVRADSLRAIARGKDGLFFPSATVSADERMLYLKLVNASDRSQEVTLDIAGAVPGMAPKR